MDRETGTTLMELLVSLIIMGLVLSLSLPSLQRLVANQRLAAAANDTLALMLQARSSSLVQGDIVICIKNTDCDDNTPGPGLIAFHDSNKNLTRGRTLSRKPVTQNKFNGSGEVFGANPGLDTKPLAKGTTRTGAFTSA